MEKVNTYLIYILLPFIFFISAVYHYAYWSNFNIDIFPHLDFNNILFGFINPFTKRVWISFLFSLIPLILALNNRLPISVFVVATSGKRLIIENIVMVAIISALLIIWHLFIGFDTVLEGIFTGVTFGLIALFVPWLILNLDSKVVLIKHKELGFTIIYIVTYITCNTYSIGNDASKRIINNTEYLYTITNFNLENNSDTVKYIGQAGGYYFFTSMNNKTKYISNKDEFKTLVLKNYQKKKILLSLY